MNLFSFIAIAGMLAAACAAWALVYVKNELVAALRKEIEAKGELIEAQEKMILAQAARIEIMDKLSCCGCGHPIFQHDDPDSADGYGCRECNCQAVHNLVDRIDRPRRT